MKLSNLLAFSSVLKIFLHNLLRAIVIEEGSLCNNIAIEATEKCNFTKIQI